MLIVNGAYIVHINKFVEKKVKMDDFLKYQKELTALYPGDIYYSIIDVPVSRIDKVINIGIEEYGITYAELQSRNRARSIVAARQMLHFVLRELSDSEVYFSKISLNLIGEYVGGVDHSTVSSSWKVVKNDIETNRVIRRHYHNIMNQIDIEMEEEELWGK